MREDRFRARHTNLTAWLDSQVLDLPVPNNRGVAPASDTESNGSKIQVESHVHRQLAVSV